MLPWAIRVSKLKTASIPTCLMCLFSSEQFPGVLPASIGHLVGTVEHPHQSLLVVDAREHYDNWRVGDDQIQVLLGEVKVVRLKSESAVYSLKLLTHYISILHTFITSMSQMEPSITLSVLRSEVLCFTIFWEIMGIMIFDHSTDIRNRSIRLLRFSYSPVKFQSTNVFLLLFRLWGHCKHWLVTTETSRNTLKADLRYPVQETKRSVLWNVGLWPFVSKWTFVPNLKKLPGGCWDVVFTSPKTRFARSQWPWRFSIQY